jgi:hypothetical protein
MKDVTRVSYGAKRKDEWGGYGFENPSHAEKLVVRYAILIYVE